MPSATVSPARRLLGRLRVPGDKSISHRYALLAALADGESRLARLTSVFVLFIMYLGIIVLWRTIEDPTRAGRVAAILTLVGAINLPIIKFSVDWWNTLHQPASVVKMSGPAIHPTILWPLLVMAIAFTLLFLTLPRPLASLYGNDAAVIAIAAALIPVAGVFQVVDGL